MRIKDMNWMQVEAYLQARRPRGAAAGQHRAACPAQPDGRLHPVRAGLRRCGRAAWACRSFPPVNYGITPYFRAFPGTISPAPGHLPQGHPRRPGQPGRSGLPAHPHRQRPWRQLAGVDPGAGMDGRSSRHRDQVPQLVERAQDLGQGEGDRSRRLACLLDGELPVDAAAGRGGAEPAEADDRL